VTDEPRRKGKRMGGTLSTRTDTTDPQLPDRRPTDQQPAAVPASNPAPAGGPTAAPDGTFTTAETGGTQLVPTVTAPAPAPASSPANGQSLDEEHSQGPVYTVPQTQHPRAEDIIRPREKIEREQISAMVPAELQLIRRMRLLWAHEGIEQRDLVALAVDRELRARGF
jgi:hypothetical protein